MCRFLQPRKHQNTGQINRRENKHNATQWRRRDNDQPRAYHEAEAAILDRQRLRQMGMDEGNFWQWAATVATGALASLGLWTTKRAIKRLDDLEAKHSALDVHVARSMVPRGEISAALDRIADKIDASSRSIRDHVDAGLQKVHERIDNHNDTHR